MARTKGAKNKPKTDQKDKKGDQGKQPQTAAPKIYNNDDPEAKALFLQHLSGGKNGGIIGLREAVARATADLRNAYKTAKAQGGFEKVDFDYAVAVKTAEAEAKTRAKIARQLTIARFMGSDLGTQLDLFLEPDRTPAADRAYHEGETASMKNEPAKPSYAPETEQYRNYMKGFHDHQEKIAKGFKGTKPENHPEVKADQERAVKDKAKTKKQREEDDKAFAASDATAKEQSSGTPMTRSEFLAQQGKGTEANGAGEETSHFQKH